MVRVESLSDVDLRPLAEAGYRERPEEWNRVEALGKAQHPKRVFAPPVGGRSVNIHVREGPRDTAPVRTSLTRLPSRNVPWSGGFEVRRVGVK
jgi:hypothetical protein